MGRSRRDHAEGERVLFKECLSCRKIFRSSGRGNRLCSFCAERNQSYGKSAEPSKVSDHLEKPTFNDDIILS